MEHHGSETWAESVGEKQRCWWCLHYLLSPAPFRLLFAQEHCGWPTLIIGEALCLVVLRFTAVASILGSGGKQWHLVLAQSGAGPGHFC